MANLKQFIQTVKHNNVARAAHYYVEIGIPSILQVPVSKIELINLYCEATQLPEFAFATTQSKVDGLNTEIVIDKTYGRLPCVFICDKDMTVKAFFDAWMSSIVRSRGGVFSYSSEYTVDKIKIFQLDTAFNPVYCVTIHDAYPRVVNDISLNYSSRDYNRLQVEFAYRYWEATSFTTTFRSPTGEPLDFKGLVKGMTPDNVPGVSAVQLIQTEIKNQVAAFPKFLETKSQGIIDFLKKTF